MLSDDVHQDPADDVWHKDVKQLQEELDQRNKQNNKIDKIAPILVDSLPNKGDIF